MRGGVDDVDPLSYDRTPYTVAPARIDPGETAEPLGWTRGTGSIPTNSAARVDLVTTGRPGKPTAPGGF
jgi:hypothetical protein